MSTREIPPHADTKAKPKRERTPAQKEASRRNDAKSRGPEPAAPIEPPFVDLHPLLTYVDDPAYLQKMFNDYVAYFGPVDAPETDLVEQLTVADPRKHRCLLILSLNVTGVMKYNEESDDEAGLPRLCANRLAFAHRDLAR